MPQLLIPDAALAASFRAAMADFAAEGRGSTDDDSALGRQLREFGAQWQTDEGLERFLDALRAEGDTSQPPPPGWVHSSTYWWAEGTEPHGTPAQGVTMFLGAIRIRHRLTPALTEHGGHIGYDIAPGARRQGHGTAMLRAALPVAAGLGIEKALITCDVGNLGSRKVIEANGGVLEDERHGMLRFWVPTTAG